MKSYRVMGDPTSSPSDVSGPEQERCLFPLITVCQEIVVTMQSHGSMNVNGAPAGRTVCICPHGKQKPWGYEHIKYQAAT